MLSVKYKQNLAKNQKPSGFIYWNILRHRLIRLCLPSKSRLYLHLVFELLVL